MKIRIIALCLVCTVISCLALGCTHIDNTSETASSSAQQELTSEEQTVSAVFSQSTTQALEVEESKPQPVKIQPATTKPAATDSVKTRAHNKQSANEDPASASNALTPQATDLATLEKLAWNFRLYEHNYDCKKDSILGVFSNRFFSDSLGEDPYGLEKYDVNCTSFGGLNMEGEEGAVFDPQHRFDRSGYKALREELLIYYKENLFNNYLPLEKEYYLNDGDEPAAYYDNGWYYFPMGWGDNDLPCKCTSCTATENGHYQIEMEASFMDDLYYNVTIDATLIEKDGMRMWKIFKITSEYCY